jgi:tetraacyldisaccharide 4'-kinase
MSDTGGKLEAFINNIWYGKSHAYVILLPLTAVFALVAALRRYLYKQGILSSRKISVPVIVIGNIAVGGAGKTPVTLWLAEFLKEKGMDPAIISRGYGGKATSSTILVTGDSDPVLVGDEPVLLARRSGCAVFVDADRVQGAAAAVHNGADVILSDDGLQHYRLQRDMEIAVIDGSRGFGNGHLLPAGPLREPQCRLDTVDHIMVQEVG